MYQEVANPTHSAILAIQNDQPGQSIPDIVSHCPRPDVRRSKLSGLTLAVGLLLAISSGLRLENSQVRAVEFPKKLDTEYKA